MFSKSLSLVALLVGLVCPLPAQEPEVFPDAGPKNGLRSTKKIGSRAAAESLELPSVQKPASRPASKGPTQDSGKAPRSGAQRPKPDTTTRAARDPRQGAKTPAESKPAKPGDSEQGSSGSKTSRPAASELRSSSMRAPMGRGPAQPQAGKDALVELLADLGGRFSLVRLGEITVDRELIAYAGDGSELFRHRFSHRARLDSPSDEIQWSQILHFGRGGSRRAWARTAGIDRPDLEARARSEVAVWAMLARYPFSLADRNKYYVARSEDVTLRGRSLKRVRLRERDGRSEVVGPRPVDESGDRIDVYIDPRTQLPFLVELDRPGVGRRRIGFSDWRRVHNGPLLPHERVFYGEDGESRALVVRWTIR